MTFLSPVSAMGRRSPSQAGGGGAAAGAGADPPPAGPSSCGAGRPSAPWPAAPAEWPAPASGPEQGHRELLSAKDRKKLVYCLD